MKKEIKQVITSCTIAMVVLMASGCATKTVRSDQYNYTKVLTYPAVRLDAGKVKESVTYDEGVSKIAAVIAWSLDMVPSAVTDTIMLPVDLMNE
jgi:uncharacterized protein YceK